MNINLNSLIFLIILNLFSEFNTVSINSPNIQAHGAAVTVLISYFGLIHYVYQINQLKLTKNPRTVDRAKRLGLDISSIDYISSHTLGLKIVCSIAIFSTITYFAYVITSLSSETSRQETSRQETSTDISSTRPKHNSAPESDDIYQSLTERFTSRGILKRKENAPRPDKRRSIYRFSGSYRRDSWKVPLVKYGSKIADTRRSTRVDGMFVWIRPQPRQEFLKSFKKVPSRYKQGPKYTMTQMKKIRSQPWDFYSQESRKFDYRHTAVPYDIPNRIFDSTPIDTSPLAFRLIAIPPSSLDEPYIKFDTTATPAMSTIGDIVIDDPRISPLLISKHMALDLASKWKKYWWVSQVVLNCKLANRISLTPEKSEIITIIEKYMRSNYDANQLAYTILTEVFQCNHHVFEEQKNKWSITEYNNTLEKLKLDIPENEVAITKAKAAHVAKVAAYDKIKSQVSSQKLKELDKELKQSEFVIWRLEVDKIRMKSIVDETSLKTEMYRERAVSSAKAIKNIIENVITEQAISKYNQLVLECKRLQGQLKQFFNEDDLEPVILKQLDRVTQCIYDGVDETNVCSEPMIDLVLTDVKKSLSHMKDLCNQLKVYPQELSLYHHDKETNKKKGCLDPSVRNRLYDGRTYRPGFKTPNTSVKISADPKAFYTKPHDEYATYNGIATICKRVFHIELPDMPLGMAAFESDRRNNHDQFKIQVQKILDAPVDKLEKDLNKVDLIEYHLIEFSLHIEKLKHLAWIYLNLYVEDMNQDTWLKECDKDETLKILQNHLTDVSEKVTILTTKLVE